MLEIQHIWYISGVFILFFFFSSVLFTLKCQPAVGVINQTTHISCSVKSLTDPDPKGIVINTVALTRIGQKKSTFTFEPLKNIVTGDPRFKAGTLPSLQLHNTAISDEGEYKYYIRTSKGFNEVQFTISVLGKREMSSSHHLTSSESKLHRYSFAPLFSLRATSQCFNGNLFLFSPLQRPDHNLEA